jgi:hypothetical protein
LLIELTTCETNGAHQHPFSRQIRDRHVGLPQLVHWPARTVR